MRFGTPDDYADRFLPEILARFSRSNPHVEVSVLCHQSVELIGMARSGDLDLAIVTYCGEDSVEVFRSEPLLWVASSQHNAVEEEVLPLALFKGPCQWRVAAIDVLTGIGRKYRVLYQSAISTAISAAVLAGLAVSAMPESALRPGMRVIGEPEGLPPLPICKIGLIRSLTRPSSPTIEKLAEHVTTSLGNLSVPMAAAE